MNELLGIDITNISFATLFVWLFYYTIKNNEKRETEINERNEKREEKYQNIIDKLADKFNLVETTNTLVINLKNEFDEFKTNIKEDNKNE